VKDQTGLLRIALDDRGVALVSLDRPDRHNALSAPLIDALHSALDRLAGDQTVRVVVLAGEGSSFCAGADIGEMRRAADAAPADNQHDAMRISRLLHRLDTLPKPTLARVHGNAFGGAVGLVAACDIAIASELAVFALSEVRLGLAPAMISPYVLRAIGPRQARRYFLTGERFSAAAAERIGLVHQVVAAQQLDATLSETVADLLAGAPGAQSECKQLIRHVAGHAAGPDPELAAWIARLRAAPEGREGLSAFLDKRPPAWRKH
jgi:methylglutaconyl-CoA hydratase